MSSAAGGLTAPGLDGAAVIVTGGGSGIGATGGFDEHLAVNVRAPFFLIQAALPALREAPVRSVVNVSSSPGTLRRVGQSVYGTGVRSLTVSKNGGDGRGKRAGREGGAAGQ